MINETDLQAAALAFGRVNFELHCTVTGEPARIVMDETRVALVSGEFGVSGPPLAAPFDDATATRIPDSSDVQVRIGENEFTATFGSDADADRLVRVLEVRQHFRGARQIEVPTRIVPAGYSGGSLPTSDYERWADTTMLASTVLMVVAWLNLTLGVIATLVALSNEGGLASFAWLAAAVAACAFPLCLAALARTVVLRFRQEDALR